MPKVRKYVVYSPALRNLPGRLRTCRSLILRKLAKRTTPSRRSSTVLPELLSCHPTHPLVFAHGGAPGLSDFRRITGRRNCQAAGLLRLACAHRPNEPQNGDWLEFRRSFETSCPSPFCPGRITGRRNRQAACFLRLRCAHRPSAPTKLRSIVLGSGTA